MFVDRPTPSVPSMAINLPLRSLGFRYVKPSPKYCASTMGSPSWFVVIQGGLNNQAHLILLFGNVLRRIHRNEAELINDLVILGQDARLKDAETLRDVLAQVHVHSCFVVLELPACSSEQTRDRDFDRHFEIEGHIRLNRKTIQLADPFRRDAEDYVAGEGSVHIPVGEHEHAGFERRKNVMIEPARKIGRMQQTERRWGEALGFLSAFGRIFDQVRGVPFREKDFMPFRLKPLMQQEKLSALAGA